MDDSITIARPYALAAYGQAEREGTIEAWSEGLELLALVTGDPALGRLLADPRVPVDRITELILSVCGDALSATMTNFVRVLGESRRLALVPAVARQFEQERRRRAGRSAIEIISAFDLEPAQAQLLAGVLERRLGHRVTVGTTVDASLIGGVVIRIGDAVIDASLRGRLRELENELA